MGREGRSKIHALNLDEDVAGATFMAGGSSSPELFTALIGIFVAKGDVGVGTIVGSAVFNVVCVIGICGLFVNGVKRLDEENNSSKIPIDNLIAMSHISYDFETAALKIMMSRYFRGHTRFRMAVRFVIIHIKLRKGQGVIRPDKPINERRFSFYQGRTPSLLAIEQPYDDWKNIPNYNYNLIGFIKWIFLLPIRILFYYTIPDCRNPRFLKWYPLTFVMTIVWLCILTYLMVWMVTIIGFTFGIPDSVMGITFLAAGSSVPDALSSVLVVRQGNKLNLNEMIQKL
ncbi:unnamed protein product [Rotaria sp. Silwood2]|nr:unnamed protein product [Rotaria sp. Silwood2]